MILGILKEQKDNRVAIIPETARKLTELGVDILVEQGAGESAFHSDQAYQEHAKIASHQDILKQADLVVCVDAIPDEDLALMKKDACIISMFAPYFNTEVVDQLKKYPIKAFSMDMIPRTTLAQSMDILSSMASIAGYKSVLKALEFLPRYMPMMITAAGSIKPSKVLVLGAGVAGLQAIATARRLGAVVEAFDTRQAAKEEVLSLGAKFVEVEGAAEDAEAGGYAVEQSEEYLKRQKELVQEKASQADILITTAQVRGRKAPVLVPKETVDKMKPGAVIVDLASSTGGNCELSKDKEVVTHNGVYIIGNSNLSEEMPEDASHLFSNNLFNFLKLLIKDEKLVLDMENQIVRESLIASNE
jgi:NAD(P) transhydrogenase subunit alpha